MPSASTITTRAIHTWPKRVRVSRVVSAPLPKTSPRGWPLTSAATSSNQARAERSTTARLLQAITLMRRSSRARHAFAPMPRNAGAATHSRNSTAPAAATLAATCTARTAISASATACLFALLPDPEAEAAFGRVGVDREHFPVDPVAAGRQRFPRNVDLGARDAGAPVDARARGVGDLRRAERSLELLREPQGDRARCRAHGAADGRTGVIELRVRVRGRARKQQGHGGQEDFPHDHPRAR